MQKQMKEEKLIAKKTLKKDKNKGRFRSCREKATLKKNRFTNSLQV